jgi:hypothetical protein
MTPEFIEKLTVWLKATKRQHKFSHKLANFVLFRKAYRVLLVTPKDTAPSYCTRDEDKNRPADRLAARFIYLTDREDGKLWEERARHNNPTLRAVGLDHAISDGGSAHIYGSCMSKEDYDIKDITLDFWAAYMQLGKCLFDYEHYRYGSFRFGWNTPGNDEARFTMIDDQTAKCKWCGDVLHLHRHLRIETHTTNDWKHQPPSFKGKTFRCSRCHRPKPISDFHQVLGERTKHPIKGTGICPSCFLAETMANPVTRRALLPKEIRTPMKLAK